MVYDAAASKRDDVAAFKGAALGHAHEIRDAVGATGARSDGGEATAVAVVAEQGTEDAAQEAAATATRSTERAVEELLRRHLDQFTGNAVERIGRGVAEGRPERCALLQALRQIAEEAGECLARGADDLLERGGPRFRRRHRGGEAMDGVALR